MNEVTQIEDYPLENFENNEDIYEKNVPNTKEHRCFWLFN